MTKSKNLIVMLAVLMLSAVLFIGCSPSGGAETSPDDQTEGQTLEDITTGQNEIDQDEADQDETQSESTISGTLKSVDAASGMITITTQNGDELAFKATSESKFFVGESSLTITELADKTDLKVNIEYDSETKDLISISIQG
ncbi:hypothetical protein OXPF_04630 [Oxobacter pfennigii]|uniref:DUF5666 domain-containing protein n=1 Tax=Oxobacter pfennigii TaxID=36849 RepID=A0A0P8X5A8_9CLOT|nr:hypothetical protein [Oxobacter pfennigii]KPU45983.1 hypothetical protein OXPF_04630 [Oxobacter pfennigii]